MLLKIGFIQYLNSLPFYHSFDRRPLEKALQGPGVESKLAARNNAGGCKECEAVEIIYAPPSKINNLLISGGVDIAFISSYEYIKNRNSLCMPGDFGIAAHNEVMSVVLVSKKDINSLENSVILLSDESASAAQLLKILLSDFYCLTRIKFKTGKLRAKDVNNTFERGDIDAVLMIGDEALRYYDYNLCDRYVLYDLCGLWHKFTGLPFVFGVLAVKEKFYAHAGNAKLCDLFLKILESKIIYFKSNLDIFAEYASQKAGICFQTMKKYYSILEYELCNQHIDALREYEKRSKK